MPTMNGDKAARELLDAARKVAAMPREEFGYNDRCRIADAMNLLLKQTDVVALEPRVVIAD